MNDADSMTVRANEAPAAAEPARACPEIRTDLVDRIRQEIAAGTYDTLDKWEAALDRLFDRLREGG